jgi:hypothetical protein
VPSTRSATIVIAYGIHRGNTLKQVRGVVNRAGTRRCCTL